MVQEHYTEGKLLESYKRSQIETTKTKTKKRAHGNRAKYKAYQDIPCSSNQPPHQHPYEYDGKLHEERKNDPVTYPPSLSKKKKKSEMMQRKMSVQDQKTIPGRSV